MQFLRDDARALGLCAGFLLLAGCGGSQATSKGSAIPQGARMIPGGLHKMSSSSGDLIYATGGCGGTCVISYPEGKVLGNLSVGGYQGAGTCTDSNGDVFIADNDDVVEYEHGGTSPIATLNLPGDNALGCSVDPTTGNLAVVFQSKNYDIAIFPEAQGKPTGYLSHLVSSNCGYDDSGNLFVDGFNGQAPGLSELPQGGSSFTKLTISPKVGEPGQVQWDGKYLTYESASTKSSVVSRLSISGSEATIVGVTDIKGIRQSFPSWIYDKEIIIPFSHIHQTINNIGAWQYPQGGKAVEKFRPGKNNTFQGVTLSPKLTKLNY